MKIDRSPLLVIIALVFCGCNAPQGTNSANAAYTVATSSSSKAVTPPQTVTIESADGVQLIGSLYVPAESNHAGILLLHQWQSDRHSYDDFARIMQAEGFTVLAIDSRGFGESIKKKDGSNVAAGRGESDLKAMLGDVGAAFEFLSKQKDVDPSKVGIVGASYGSSLALIFAADERKVAAVALLSPGLNYFDNMPTEPAVKKYGDRPIFLIAADDDKESADAVKTLAKDQEANKTRQTRIYSSGGHGTALFKSQPSFTDELKWFLIWGVLKRAA